MRRFRVCSWIAFALLVGLLCDAAHGEGWRRHFVDNTSRGADGARLADVNGDGLPDIATGWEEGGLIRAYLNPGPHKASQLWPRVTVGTVKSPEDAVFVDLDADGATDVVSCCEGGNRTVYVHWAPHDRHHYLDPDAWTTEPIPVTQKQQLWMFALPLQIDGRYGIDLIVGSKGREATIGWLQSPENARDLSGWTFHKLYDAGWIMSLEPCDVDGDGDMDVIASDRKGGHRGVLWLENPGPASETGDSSPKQRGQSPFLPSQWSVHRIGADGQEVMFLDVVDFDGDGQRDVVAAIRPGEIQFLRHPGDPREPWPAHVIRFPKQVEGLEPGTAKSVRAADVNLDGRIDLLVTCEKAAGSKTGAFWMSYRNSVTDADWEPHAIGGAEGLKYDLIQVLDLDADGDLDLLTCEERDLNAVVWYENPTRSPARADFKSTPQRRPNIVFILTDDQGPFAVGGFGDRQYQTPNMDRLLREGAHLVNAFVATPVCSPSRAELITGRFATEWGITDWINPQQEPELGLNPTAVTWPQLLQRAGYHTGLVGKWHLGTQDRFHPTQFGYEYFMGFRAGGTSPKNTTLEIDGRDKPFQGLTVDILTDHAIEFIKRNRDHPFLLALHHRSPHAPYLPVADVDWQPFANLDPRIPEFPRDLYGGLRVDYVKRRMREYMASVAGVDRNLGRVLKTLDELNLAEDTLVVFTSDHGYNTGHHGVWYKGNALWVVNDPPPGSEHVPQQRRPNMFDTSLRVPCLVRWPGVIKPGTTITETVTNLDWFPTLLAAAGVRVPEDVPLRGRSFLPLLKGEPVEDWNNDVYAEYSMLHGARTHMRAIRTPEWKLIRDFLDPSRDELYHLADDPHEATNLIQSDKPEVKRIIAKLHETIISHMQEIGDPVLKSVETGR